MSLFGLGTGSRIGVVSPCWADGERPIRTVSIRSAVAPPEVTSVAMVGRATGLGLAVSTAPPQRRQTLTPGRFG